MRIRKPHPTDPPCNLAAAAKQPGAPAMPAATAGPQPTTIESQPGSAAPVKRLASTLAFAAANFARFRGEKEADEFRAGVNAELAKYVTLVEKWGYAAEYRAAFGVDLIEELEDLSVRVAKDYPRAVFFCGDLTFTIPSFLTRLLHARTAEEMQRRFRNRSLPLVVMPIRV